MSQRFFGESQVRVFAFEKSKSALCWGTKSRFKGVMKKQIQLALDSKIVLLSTYI